MVDRLLMIPGPTDLDPRVIAAMNRQMIDHRSPEFRELMERLEERCRRIFKTENDVFILTCSGTGGVEFAVANVVDRSDNVLVPVFGVLGDRLAKACELYCDNVRRVEIPTGRAVNPDLLRESLEKYPDTTIVAFPYNDTSTGTICYGLGEMIKICKERNILTVVDMVSILGGADIPVDRLGIDVCITGSQKCLAAPPGLALVSFSKNAFDKAVKKKVRPHYFDVMSYKRFLEERKETPFTPAITLFFALDEALRIILEEVGYERWVKRHEACAKALYTGLEELGLGFFAEERFRSPTVVAIKPPEGKDVEELRKIVRERFNILIAGGLAQYRGKMFRVANIGNVSGEKVTRTIDAIGRALNMLGIKTDVEKALEECRSVLSKLWPG